MMVALKVELLAEVTDDLLVVQLAERTELNRDATMDSLSVVWKETIRVAQLVDEMVDRKG